MKCPTALAVENKILQNPHRVFRTAMDLDKPLGLAEYCMPYVFASRVRDVHVWDYDTMGLLNIEGKPASLGMTYANYFLGNPNDMHGNYSLTPKPAKAHVKSKDGSQLIYLGGINNIGHWFYNYMGRIAILDRLGMNRMGNMLLVREDMAAKPSYMQWLNKLWRGDIMTVPDSFTCDELWVVSTPAYRGQWINNLACVWPDAYYWLRDKLTRPVTTSRKIFVSRERCRWRRVLNEAEVMDELSKHGFEKIHFEDMPLDDQLDLYANTRAMVTPIAASQPICGILGPSHMGVIEFAPSTMAATFGSRIWADFIGQRVGRITCQADHNDADVTVNMDELRKMVEKI